MTEASQKRPAVAADSPRHTRRAGTLAAPGTPCVVHRRAAHRTQECRSIGPRPAGGVGRDAFAPMPAPRSRCRTIHTPATPGKGTHLLLRACLGSVSERNSRYCAVVPRSGEMVVPVMVAAASLHRKATTPAISEASISRGCRASKMRDVTSSGLMLLWRGFVLLLAFAPGGGPPPGEGSPRSTPS